MAIKVLKHKGYQGSVEYNLEKERLEGKVLHVKSLITYAGNTIAELKASFEEEIEEYLADCEELGVEPEKPFCGTFQIRLDPNVHRKLAYNAAEAGVGFNQYVSDILNSSVESSSLNQDAITQVAIDSVTRRIEETYDSFYRQASFAELSSTLGTAAESNSLNPWPLIRARSRTIDFSHKINVEDEQIEYSS